MTTAKTAAAKTTIRAIVVKSSRGRVVKLTPAMVARLVEEQGLDAVVKAAWANGCPIDKEA